MGAADEIRMLMRRAEKFLRIAKLSLKNKDYDIAAFSAEQAAQLALKAALLRERGWYPRTHSIRRLIKLLRKPKLLKLLDDELELVALEDAYVTSRYFTREFTREEVARMIDLAKRIISSVRE